MIAARRYCRAAGQSQGIHPFRIPLQRHHGADVDQGRPAYPNEIAPIPSPQALLEPVHGDAHDVTARPGVHPDLVPGALDPLDPVDVQEHEPLAVAHDEPPPAGPPRLVPAPLSPPSPGWSPRNGPPPPPRRRPRPGRGAGGPAPAAEP